jgi:hypothetical protein
MTTNDPNRLSALNTHWQNRSLSSVTSDAATFHSAHAHHELSLLSTPMAQSTPISQPTTISPTSTPCPTSTCKPISAKLESTLMSRTDSGFCDGPQSSTSSRRTSTSSNPTSSLPSRTRPNRKTSASSRPSTKRSPRSSPATAQTQRPNLQSRHTTPAPYHQYQFTHFPSLPPPSPPQEVAALPRPPPATCQYWTSDSTRRLEYAAIDAAGTGIRGFFIKLVPDCILPKNARRTRFCEGDDQSDAGSVRRYRIPLAGEKVVPSATESPSSRSSTENSTSVCGGSGSGSGGKRPGMLRRLTSSFKATK